MVYDGISNTMYSRTIPAIVVRESNMNGRFCFMSLESGKRTHANKWVQLPISDNIIHKVHQLPENEGSNHNQDESISLNGQMDKKCPLLPLFFTKF